MDVTAKMTVTIQLPPNEVKRLFGELDDIELTDVEQPLLYKLWKELGKLPSYVTEGEE